ncbi:TonB-dependent receptor [uncultured Sphingomonas sp.]|uniref:TonB-dependent receptor n=1 Tax=uncultured Sphingomonas sp. TaxID=158754 RepID=UPI0025DAD6D6|nr:TonB-dependent receptor [uncultured Sphingomonas sp.]
MLLRTILLSCTALALQTAWSGQAMAQANTDAEQATAEGPEEIVILGRGETRQVQTLTKADIDVAPPATSPIKVLAKLPSVNFQSGDPLGINEYSTSISVRSFGQTQLGYTLDGLPLGDMSYANFNGLHISRATISENIGAVELAQGAGALDTASSSNLGGTIKFSTVDPTLEPGVLAEAGYGSENTYRLFARLDSGDLGNAARGYLSGARLDQPHWKGKGKTTSWQANAKLILPLGPDTTVTAYGAYSDLATDDYMDMSKALIERYGWKWDYLRYDWQTAVDLAKAYQANPAGDCTTNVYPNGIRCVDDAYFDGTTLRRDYLGYVRLDSQLADNVKIRIQPYIHRNRGEGTWWYPYSGTPGGAPLFVRSSGYRIQREGTTASMTLNIANHDIEFGGWYEHNRFMYRRFKYGIDADGGNWDHRQWPKQSDRFDRYYDYRYTVNTYQGFLQDTWQVTDALKVTGGFKAQDVGVTNDIRYTTISQAAGKITAKDLFLPQIGANYMIDPKFELFAGYAENMSAFGSGPFGTTQAAFDANKDDLKPESSRTVEGGVRVHLPRFEGLLSAYHVTFKNRLAGFSPCSLIETCTSITSNVGSVHTNGVEVAGTYRPLRYVSLFGSYSFTHAKYADDTLNGAGEVVLATDDNYVTGVPKHIANSEIAYDNGLIFGRINGSYQSKRYYTYLNDGSLKGRFLTDLTLGFRTPSSGPLGGLEIQGNVTNLFDKKYIATGGSTNSDAAGTYQGLMIGAPRQVFVTVRKRF